MDMAWSYYLQKKVENQLKKENKNKELIIKENIGLDVNKKLSEKEKKFIPVNYCNVCGQQLYFCMCSKNLEQMNSKNLEIHIEHS